MATSVNIRQVVKRVLCRTPGVLVILALAFLFYVSTVGFPAWITERIIRKVNSAGSVVLDCGAIKLAPLRLDLVMDDVRLYRKKVVGPAAVEAKLVEISLDATAIARKQFCISRIKVSDGVIRPKLCYGQESGPRDIKGEEDRKASCVIELAQCMIQGVNVVSLSSDLDIEGTVVRFSNIGGTLSHGNMRGDVSGQLVYDDKTMILDGRLLTQLDPHILIPLMHEWDMPGTIDLVSRFGFSDQIPKFEVTFRKLNSGLGDFTLDGKFAIFDCSYQAVDIVKARGGVHIELAGSNAIVRVEIGDLIRPEGSVRTTFTVDLDRRTVAFDGMSEIHTPSFFQMVGVFTNECRQYFRFDGPVKFAASGVVDYGGLTNTNFRGIVETERMGVGPFMTEKGSFGITMVGLTTTVSDVRGRIYGGEVSGSAVFVVPSHAESNVSYMVDAVIKDVDFKGMAREVIPEAKDLQHTGNFGGWVKLKGMMGEGNGKTALGDGGIYIQNGRIFTLQVFGGLTGFMTKYVPGVDFILAQTDAKAKFSIGAGRVSSDEVLVEGGMVTLSGEGCYYFDKKLDFNVKVKLLKKKTVLGQIVQFITDPISELFEFKLKGTLSKPEWSSKHL